jgi:hypothetical protein
MGCQEYHSYIQSIDDEDSDTNQPTNDLHIPNERLPEKPRYESQSKIVEMDALLERWPERAISTDRNRQNNTNVHRLFFAPRSRIQKQQTTAAATTTTTKKGHGHGKANKMWHKKQLPSKKTIKGLKRETIYVNQSAFLLHS